MKNTKNILVGAMIAMTIATYANANNNTSLHTSVEEKTKVTLVNSILPVSLPALETPAPVAVRITNDTNKPNAVQKAAIVGLQLKSQSTK